MVCASEIVMTLYDTYYSSIYMCMVCGIYAYMI